jgi:hypothetical protein
MDAGDDCYDSSFDGYSVCPGYDILLDNSIASDDGSMDVNDNIGYVDDYFDISFSSQVEDWTYFMAVTWGVQSAGNAIPTVCGGGGFLFAGSESGGTGGLIEYDSTTGGSVNLFGEGENSTTGAGGGGYSNGTNGVNPFVFIPAAGDGGIIAFGGGIGIYAGEAEGDTGYGAGLFVNVNTVNACGQ